MTPQEREVIDGIFERLKPAATQPRDPDAERHIAELLRQQPYATYVLAQSVYVQEQALTNLARENEQLKGQLAEAERRAAQPAQGGGFLSSIFGGGAPAARPEPRSPFAQPGQPQGGQPGGPWGGAQRMGMQPQEGPQGGMQGGPWGGAAAQQRGGSGFLGTALTAAAGVAGGMVVGNMLMNAFKGGGGSGDHGASAQPSSDFQPFGPSGGESQAANYADEGDRGGYEQDVGYDDGGYDSGGDSYDA